MFTVLSLKLAAIALSAVFVVDAYVPPASIASAPAAVDAGPAQPSPVVDSPATLPLQAPARLAEPISETQAAAEEAAAKKQAEALRGTVVSSRTVKTGPHKTKTTEVMELHQVHDAHGNSEVCANGQCANGACANGACANGACANGDCAMEMRTVTRSKSKAQFENVGYNGGGCGNGGRRGFFAKLFGGRKGRGGGCG